MEKMILSASETAEALSIDKGKILCLLDQGEIPAFREGRNWKIPRMSLEAYLIKRAEAEAKMRREVAKEVNDESDNETD